MKFFFTGFESIKFLITSQKASDLSKELLRQNPIQSKFIKKKIEFEIFFQGLPSVGVGFLVPRVIYKPIKKLHNRCLPFDAFIFKYSF